jgi:CRP/FNR family cyclic AMP-dependent transcriptional regulator
MVNLRFLDRLKDPEQMRRLELLAKVPLFTDLSHRQLGKLLVKLFEKHYRAAEMIFTQGEPGKALFIVLSGKVSIVRDDHEIEELLATLIPGGYFGEMALIDDEPRFASARADEPSVLLMLYKSDFDDLIESHSMIAIKVMSKLLRTLAGYIRAAHSQGSNRNTPIATVIAAKTKAG